MWRPLIERGSHSWIGSTEQPGIRIGRREGTPSAVTLNDPVFLWPLLEKPFHQVVVDLSRCWPEFRLEKEQTASRLLGAIVRSAIDAERPYWIDLSLNWLEELLQMFSTTRHDCFHSSAQSRAAGNCRSRHATTRNGSERTPSRRTTSNCALTRPAGHTDAVTDGRT